MAGVSILFISGSEIFIILLVVLLLFGANKLPEIARGLGKGMNEFRRATRDIRTEFDEQTKDIQKDVKEMKKDIEDQTRFNLNDNLFDDDDGDDGGGRREEKSDESNHTPGDQQFQEKTRTPEDHQKEGADQETLGTDDADEDHDPGDPYGLNKEKGTESETDQDRKDDSRTNDSHTSENENTTSGQ